jgi:hypothetical protein
MQRTWQFSIGRLLIVTAALGVAFAGWTKASRLQRDNERLSSLLGPWPRLPNDAYLRSQPLSVMMSDQKGMRINGNWYAAVDFAGQGLLEVRNLTETHEAEFAASKSQLAEFRESLITEHFFALPDEIGDNVPDGGMQSITVVVGAFSKTVRINYLGNLANPSPQTSYRGRQQEAANALRLWLLARGWFHHPDAVDGVRHTRNTLAKLDPSVPKAPSSSGTSVGSTND